MADFAHQPCLQWQCCLLPLILLPLIPLIPLPLPLIPLPLIPFLLILLSSVHASGAAIEFADPVSLVFVFVYVVLLAWTLLHFERREVHQTDRRFSYELYSFQPNRYDMMGFGPSGISFASKDTAGMNRPGRRP